MTEAHGNAADAPGTKKPAALATGCTSRTVNFPNLPQFGATASQKCRCDVRSLAQRRRAGALAAVTMGVSLLGRENSLFAVRKFPVRSRREFGFSRLICFVNSQRKRRRGGMARIGA